MNGADDTLGDVARQWAGCITLAEVEAIVDRHQRDLVNPEPAASPNRVTLERHGEPLPASSLTRWVRGWFGVDVSRVDGDHLGAALADGASIRLHRVDQLPTAPAGSGGAAVDAVATWKHGHVDRTVAQRRVLVAQVIGRQRFDLGDGCVDLGPGETTWVAAGSTVLRHGPLDEQPSLHLEVTPDRPVIGDYLAWLRRYLPEDDRLRTGLPVSGDGEAADHCMREIREGLRDTLDRHPVATFVEEWDRRHEVTNRPSWPHSASRSVLPEDTSGTAVSFPPSVQPGEDRLETWFPQLSETAVALLLEAKSGPVPLDRLLALPEAKAMRRAVTDLVLAGKLMLEEIAPTGGCNSISRVASCRAITDPPKGQP